MTAYFASLQLTKTNPLKQILLYILFKDLRQQGKVGNLRQNKFSLIRP